MAEDDKIHACAIKLVETIADCIGDLPATSGILATFGTALMISRELGIDDHELHQRFGMFLEENEAH